MENERNQENGERFLLPFEYIIENLTTSPMPVSYTHLTLPTKLEV